MNSTKQKTDVYQLVTDRIVEALDQGVIPWKKTWNDGERAQNFVSKHLYSGINALLTSLSPHATPYFLTFKQAKQLGGKIKSGAKSIPIVYWKVVWYDQDGHPVGEEERKGRTDLRKRFFARYYRVFNIEDTEGISFYVPDQTQNPDHITACEALVLSISNPPEIYIGGNQAYYAPPIDRVQMPDIKQFVSPEAYYATLFHELIHATGHHSRLKREEVIGQVKFASLEYSQEELTAEIGAAFLCNLVGIETDQTLSNSAAYIQGWLEILKGDKRFIMQAASKAKASVKYLTQ